MRKMRILILSTLALCACLPMTWGADAPAVLGILEIRGLDHLSGSVFELTKAAGQPIPREMVSMMMHGALGTMPGMGLQPNGKVRAVWLEGDTEKGIQALLLPVENDGDEYLASLGQAGWKNESETADGLLHFVAPDGSGVAWKDVYFLKRGATLLAGPGAEDVRKADATRATLPPILPAEGNLALQIRPAALMAAFGPQIAESMDQAFKAQPGAPREVAAMGELHARAYIAVAKQFEAFTVGLGVADGNLNLHTRLEPVAGTTLAKWLATVRPPSAATSVVNLPGALFAETLHMGDLNLLAPAYFRYAEALMKLVPQEDAADSFEGYLENAKACFEQMGSDFGIALLPPTKENPLRFAEYVALKDATALRALTRQMVQDENAMMAAMEAGDTEMPIKVELAFGEPREYRAIPVDHLTYRLTPGAQLLPIWPERLPTELAIELAWIPGGMLVSVGDPALTETLVDRVLDGAASPISDTSSWKALYPMPEPDLVDLAHFSLFDTLRSYLELYADAGAATEIPEGPGNLATSSYIALDGLMNRVRFGLSDIGAIAAKVKEAQEKAMDARMQRMKSQGFTDQYDFESDGDMEDEEWNADDAGENSEGENDESVPAPAPAMAE